MTFKPIPGFPNYQISKTGILFSLKKKKVVKEKPGGTRPYPRYELWLNGKRFHKWVHRLVCEIWIGSCDGMEVHHKNGDVFDYRAVNLVPLTHEEHLEATRRLRAKKAKQRAEELKQDCPF